MRAFVPAPHNVYQAEVLLKGLRVASNLFATPPRGGGAHAGAEDECKQDDADNLQEKAVYAECAEDGFVIDDVQGIVDIVVRNAAERGCGRGQPCKPMNVDANNSAEVRAEVKKVARLALVDALCGMAQESLMARPWGAGQAPPRVQGVRGDGGTPRRRRRTQ